MTTAGPAGFGLAAAGRAVTGNGTASFFSSRAMGVLDMGFGGNSGAAAGLAAPGNGCAGRDGTAVARDVAANFAEGAGGAKATCRGGGGEWMF